MVIDRWGLEPREAMRLHQFSPLLAGSVPGAVVRDKRGPLDWGAPHERVQAVRDVEEGGVEWVVAVMLSHDQCPVHCNDPSKLQEGRCKEQQAQLHHMKQQATKGFIKNMTKSDKIGLNVGHSI